MTASLFAHIIHEIRFNTDGLVPVIAQNEDGKVLMMAWMNEEALIETLHTRHMCYYSRSRQQLWRKGETSGNHQTLLRLMIDCDGDTLLAIIKQRGPACHTGSTSCFFRTIEDNAIVTHSDPSS